MDVVGRIKNSIIIGGIGLLVIALSILNDSEVFLLLGAAVVIVAVIVFFTEENVIDYGVNFLILGAGIPFYVLMEEYAGYYEWFPITFGLYGLVILDFFLQHFCRISILTVFLGMAGICTALVVRPLNIGCGLLVFVGVWLLGRNLVKVSHFYQKRKIKKYEDAYEQDLIAYYAEQPLTQELYSLLKSQPRLFRVTLCYNSVQYADYRNASNPQNCLFSNLGDGFGELTDDFHIQACGQALLAKLGDAFVIRDEDKQSAVTLVRQK